MENVKKSKTEDLRFLKTKNGEFQISKEDARKDNGEC